MKERTNVGRTSSNLTLSNSVDSLKSHRSTALRVVVSAGHGSQQPHENGLFSEGERAFLLRAMGRCYPCGIRTHRDGNPLTNHVVYDGICIMCNLRHFSKEVRRQIQRDNRVVQHAK